MIQTEQCEKDWLAQAGDLSRRSFHAQRMSEAVMREGISEIYGNMKDYARTWRKNADCLRNAGVYKRISELVQPVGCYLDVGCGTGELLTAVNFPNSIGIDINHYSLAKAEQHLSSLGIPVNSFAHSVLEWVDDTGMVVVPIASRAGKIFERGKINLLQDDMRSTKRRRSLDITRSRLKEIGNPDFITFMLPGGGGHTTGEVYISEQREHNLYLKLANEFVETSAKLLPRGGYYLEALRLATDIGKGVREEFEKAFGNIFAIEHAEVFDISEEATDYNFYPSPSAGRLSSKDSASENHTYMSVIKARRK